VRHASGPLPGYDKLRFYAAGQRYWRGSGTAWFEGFKETDDAFAYNTFTTTGLDAGTSMTDTVRLGMNIAPGRYPGYSQTGWTFNGNMVWDLKALRVKVGGTYNAQRYQDGATEPTILLVDPARQYLYKYNNYSAYVNLTHTVNPTMYYTLNVNMFTNQNKSGDPWLGWDRADWPSWGDPIVNPALADTSQIKSLNAPGNFTMSMPGTPMATFEKNYTNLMGGKLDITKQVGSSHEFKVGGEVNYYTLLRYSINARNYLARQYTASKVAGTANYMTDWDFYRGLYPVFIGYDIHGEKEVNEDEFYASNIGGQEVSLNAHNKPAHPLVSGAYIQDRIELKDMIINAGVRLDYIDNGQPGLKDLAKLTMGQGQTIGDENFTDNRTYTYLSPRLGFSFPVTDKVIFHAQYGKYVQPPPFTNAGAYNTRGYMTFATYLYGGGYAANFANPNLKPERQTTYEFGFKQELGGIASIDATAFYKDTRDLTTLRVIFPEIADYRAPYFHMNGDFGTVKGVSFTFNLRRTSRFTVWANYTYSDAKGTGSTPNGHFDIAWQEQSPTFPVVIGALDFDQRHKGNLDVDYRFTKDEGPTLFGMKPLANFGANMAISFHSGTPYTRVSASYGSESNFTFNAPQPLEGYNASTIGWFFNADLKVDKGISIGPLDLNVYLWAQNVFNNKSQTGLWRATGRADDDGWLATPAGQAYAKQYGETGLRWYKAMMTNCGTFGWQAPRVVRAGLKFDF